MARRPPGASVQGLAIAPDTHHFPNTAPVGEVVAKVKRFNEDVKFFELELVEKNSEKRLARYTREGGRGGTARGGPALAWRWGRPSPLPSPELGLSGRGAPLCRGRLSGSWNSSAAGIKSYPGL